MAVLLPFQDLTAIIYYANMFLLTLMLAGTITQADKKGTIIQYGHHGEKDA